VLDKHGEYVRQETLSDELLFGPAEDSAYVEEQAIEGHTVKMAVLKS
jgi:hypothetical protein